MTGREIDEFVLGELIGDGGQCAVYRAAQPALQRDVVVKVLREERRLSNDARWRFLNEAQLASRLDHPYAAHIYRCGVVGPGLVWIAMEFVHGVTLNAWLATHGPMPLEQLVPFIEAVAEVVHAAHKLGIVHRDIKPANIMIVVQNGRMMPKLLDFGIAKATAELALQLQAERRARARQQRIREGCDDGPSTNTAPGAKDDEQNHITAEGTPLGSAPYMSPEQWRDSSSVGPAADIYAIGVLIHRAITGRNVFEGKDAADYRAQHQNEAPPRLGGELAGIDNVIQRSLACQ